MGCTDCKLFVSGVLLLAFAAHQKCVYACGGCGPSPRNGKWGSWGSWSSCRSGSKTRYRYCNNPSPAHGGRGCSGSSQESTSCYYNPCSSAGCQHICISSGGVTSCRCSYGYITSPYDLRKCVRNSCQRLTAPTNGEIWPPRCLTSPTHGDSCFYKCKPGYEGFGVSTKSCNRGNWDSSASFRCQVKECPPLNKPDRGDVVPQECQVKPLHGQKCSYECYPGYQAVGANEVTCDDGRWTGSIVHCKDIQAPFFNETCPSDLSVLADEGKTSATVSWGPVIATDNDRAFVTVTPNVTSPYVFSEGGHTLTYTATDPSGNTRFCHFRVTVLVLRCAVLFPPANGKLENEACGNVHGRVCRFSCNKGYELRGSIERKCEKKADLNAVYWTGNTTYCEAIRCPTLNTSENAIQIGYGCTGPSSVYDASCFFHSKLGYEAVRGSSRRTCLENTEWSGTQLECQAITCPHFAVKSEGLDTSPAFCTNSSAAIQYLQECRFACKDGYQQYGPGIKTCGQSKTWFPLGNPSCRDIRGPEFFNCPSNIETYADRGDTSTQVTWSPPTATDNSGFIPNITHFGKQPGDLFSSGEHIIRYLASDKSGNVAECRFRVFVSVIRCVPRLYAPAGGTLQCTKDNQYGSECSINCHTGRTLTGSALRVCEKDPESSIGFWKGNETSCELAQCPRLVPPPHSLQSGCGGGSINNLFGDKCLFYCDIGNQMINGSSERTCQANGTWSGEALHCQVVQCRPLQAPEDGEVTPTSCKAVPKYDTTCHFTCQKGYRLSGWPVVSCLSNGEWSRNTTTLCKDVDSPSFGLTCPRDIRKYADWGRNYTTITWPPVIASDNSGEEPNVTSIGVASIYYIGKHQVFYNATDQAGNYKICTFYITVEVLRCQTLLPPLNGFFVGDCVSTYGSTCRINCNNGYYLIGSENVTCLNKPGHIIGYWDKPSGICRARSCSSLSAPQHGFLYPHMCKSFPVSGTTCFFECKHGYQSNGGINWIQCGLDGKWNGTQSFLLKCLDVTSPIFLSCPSDIRVSLSVNSTVLVNWTEPVARDNSNLLPNITVDPSGLRPPYRFNETTLVVYTAMDGSGNKQQCSFKVILEDELSPEVVYCPADQSITATATKTMVTWDEPQFRDNSNDPLTIKCSHRSGTEFYWGTWNVHCTAQDNNPNNEPALCQFTLTIKPKDCPDLSPPKNGAKACDDWMFGRMCSPFCNDRWDFAQKLTASVWACGASGVWFPSDPWPDCSEVYRAGSARMEMHLHYFTGDCNSPEARAEIALNFIQLLNTSVFKNVCQDPSLKDKCRAENVKVTCAEVEFSIFRRKRDLFMYAVLGTVNGAHHRERRSVSRATITSDLVVNLDGIQANSTKEGQIMVGEEGMKIAKNMSSVLKSAVNNDSLVLSINGTDIKPDKQSLNISEPKCVCSIGQVYKDGYCLNCSVGTYLNKTTEKCEDCPIGTYQEHEGQEQCLACPPKTSTAESRTGNRSNCLALCKAGSFSPTGLEPCITCDKGLYQEMVGQRQCLKCSVNETTPAEGSKNSTQCGVPCSPGSFSPTGLAPCTSCDRRSFQPLSESRACFSCPGTTATINPGSRNGQDCLEINECDSSPCKNNSTCTDLIGDFLCTCQPGYTGKECDTNIDECKDQPCFNNGTCHDLVNNHTCSCAQGFQGFYCNEDIDECTSSPCPENATCENLPGRYKCQCEPGFTGSLCDKDIDECLTSPCQNGATCTDQINYYECLCASGFQGNDCEENINDCANNSCQNGGICRDGINSYDCVCPAGFNGTGCEYNIDECAGADCQNNATCIDEVNGFFCICNKGFSGVSCEINIDECFSNPCKNQATCLDEVNSYNCKCPDGFGGLHCENNIDDCATFPCSNNGSCKDGVNGFSCACPPGFSGKICNMDIDFCASMPCLNNGSCFDGITSFTCECADGFDGEQCQTNMDNCINATCMNNSTCIDGIAEFRCACAEGFAGANCEINIDDCEQNPCLNDGICTDMTDDYRCNCARGYIGKNCSINIDECSNSPCYNNATCVDKVDNYTCICLNGFSGRHCELDIDDCLMNPCSNRSTCNDGLNSYTCHCEPGFTGDSCDVDINECSSFPCYYGGKCYDQVNGFTCVCPSGFKGSRCEVNIDDCESHACVNGGICLDLIANYSCLCPDGFSGSHCEKVVDYCREANCTANGYCVNSRTGYYCNCSAGYYGKYCEFETDECLTRPCFNNATCHDANSNFSCSCLDGFTGKYCEVDINDCVENTCLNNATCIDETPGYYCVCPAGYNGTHCQTEINECESNPCSNDGTCTDLTPGYNCKCTDQFYGENCENLIDICQSAPCQHGGTCNADNSTGNYTCSCLSGFTGFACEVDIDDCAPDRCPANAFCIDLVNDFRCECFPSYLGDRCDIFLGSNFDLIFKRQSSKDMVLLPDGQNIPSMTGFTIAQFVQADSKYKSGTLFSYSVPENPEDIIILSFTEFQIILAIKNEEVRADFRLADDNWHFVGVIWDGGLGSASVYIDGMEIAEVSNLQAENIIRGGGWIALGQRYLAEQKITALSSAFVGRLHQVSIWNVAATRDHMWNAAHDCSWPIAGSLRAWSSFLPGIKGQVEKRFMTQCKALKMCTTNCSHFLHCESRDGFYYCSCQAGFTGAHCNINMNDCSPNSCLNGKCVDGVNRFECICNKGYYGKNCEKKIVSEGECPDFKQPKNGKVSCHKVSGQMLCILSCDEGFSFSAEAITQYSCGPESEWKWNGMEEVQVPTCLRKAPPMEIKHDFSIKFPGMQCSSSQNHKELRTAIESEIRDTLLTVQGCQSCQLQEVKVPECEISANRKRKAVEQAMEVIFSLIVSKATDAYENDVEEKNEAVLFQMTSAVATGQFVINLNGINISADRSSFQVLRSSVTCRAGFLMSRDGKGCVACLVGTFHDQGSSRCRPCAQGSYQDKEGQSVCTVCGEGKSTSITGATSSNDCSYDEDSVNIHVIATVTACVTGVIILGVIIAYKRFCTCKSNRFKKNRVSDSSSNLRLPLPEPINSVGEKNNSGEKYQLYDKTPDVIVRQKSIS